MTLDRATLAHLRGLLEAAGERGAVAVVDDLLLLADVATGRQPVAIAVAVDATEQTSSQSLPLPAEVVADAPVQGEPVAVAVVVEPQGRQVRTYTARDLQRTLFMAWGKLNASAPKGPETLTSEARRRAFMLGAWGVNSTTLFTDAHANGPRGVSWLAGLTSYPKALNFAVEDFQRAALEDPSVAPTVVELEAADAA